MSKGGGLRPLQMGVAGHDRLGVFFGLVHQNGLEFQQHFDDLGDLVLDIEPEIHRHLIVSGTSGVKPLAVGADPGGEKRLNVHVDVFIFHGEFHIVVFDVLKNGFQAVDDGLRFLHGDDALPPQHGGVGNGTLNVLPVQPGIKGDGGVKVID